MEEINQLTVIAFNNEQVAHNSAMYLTGRQCENQAPGACAWSLVMFGQLARSVLEWAPWASPGAAVRERPHCSRCSRQPGCPRAVPRCLPDPAGKMSLAFGFRQLSPVLSCPPDLSGWEFAAAFLGCWTSLQESRRQGISWVPAGSGGKCTVSSCLWQEASAAEPGVSIAPPPPPVARSQLWLGILPPPHLLTSPRGETQLACSLQSSKIASRS